MGVVKGLVITICPSHVPERPVSLREVEPGCWEGDRAIESWRCEGIWLIERSSHGRIRNGLDEAAIT
jgi:hypothetical protein